VSEDCLGLLFDDVCSDVGGVGHQGKTSVSTFSTLVIWNLNEL